MPREHLTYLLLGSNLGQRQHILQVSIELIELHVGKIIGQSSLYETEPWGFKSNHLFLNQVVVVKTILSPEDLLKKSQEIEQQLGRTNKTKAGYLSRTIDIDILFYEDQIINHQHLIVPHPQLHKRRFTLSPLAEIAPEFEHPVLKKKIYELMKQCNDPQKVTRSG